MIKKDELKLSRFDVIDYLDDGEVVINFLRVAIEEGDEDCIEKAVKDVGRAFDKVIEENNKFKKQLKIIKLAYKALEEISDVEE